MVCVKRARHCIKVLEKLGEDLKITFKDIPKKHLQVTRICGEYT